MQDYKNIDILSSSLSELGYIRQDIEINQTAYARFISPNGVAWVTHMNHIGFPFKNTMTCAMSRDKFTSYRIATDSNINVPPTLKISKRKKGSDRQEISNLLQNDAPLIVKPNDASLSKGLSLNIFTKNGLRKATKKALCYSDSALIQKQIAGEEIRFTIINGVVRSALLRQTPRVVGDGVHNITELITKENIQRSKIHTKYVTYPELSPAIIDEAWFSDSTVPKNGEIIELGLGTMIMHGASVFEIIESVDNSYKDIAQKLAFAIGAKFIVVDLFVLDYKRKANENNYWFMEYNCAPVLKFYYSTRSGGHFDVLKYLIPLIDSQLQLKDIR